RNRSKNNRKKSTSYVNKDDQPSSNGSMYDGSEVMMLMSVEALLDWIMDSGGSYHMTPMLDLFYDFLECDGGRVLLGDNRECKIRGLFYLEPEGIIVYTLWKAMQSGELNASVEEKGEAGLQEGMGLYSQVQTRSIWKVQIVELVENQTGRTVKKVRTDNGLEFCNRSLSSYALRSGLPKTFWAEATCTAAYLINRSPSTAIEKKTPMEMWSGNSSDYGDGDDFWLDVAFNTINRQLKDVVRDKSVEELQVEVELQRLNNHTHEEDQIDQEDGNDEDAGDQGNQ
ncbi:retrovirus-related pol polyprotein from transposon TNT 1-94, partial [Tanacetum coccineum]